MEYNYQGRTVPNLPSAWNSSNGKPELGLELDHKQLTRITEITEPVTARADLLPSDCSITNR